MAGKAGSLLIDIAANTAQLKKDFDEAKATVSSFGEGLAGLAKGAVTALAGIFAVDKIKAFAEEVNRSGIAAQEAANRYKLTSEQVQALEVISRRTGQSMEELAKIGKQNVDWLEQVTEEARRGGQVIDSEYTAKLKLMSDEAEEANKRLLVLFAPAVTGTKSWIADALERISSDLAAIAAQQGIIDTLIELARMLTFSGSVGSGQDFQLSARVRAAASAEAEYQQMLSQQRQNQLGMGFPVDPAGLEAVRKKAEDAAVALGQYRDAQNRAGYGAANQQLPPTVVTGTAGGGSGGAVDERFARALQSLKDQAEAVQTGIATLGTASGLATKEAERLAQLQIDIGTRTAQAIKAAHTTDPVEKDQLAQAARQLEELKAKYADLKATQATADTVNEKYGDGTKKLADQLFYLNKAFAAGKIGLTEYNAALYDYQKAAQQQADLNEGLKGGLEGFFGGVMSGAHGLSDQLADFKLGQEAFADGFRLMQDAISEFVQTGTIDFGKLAQSFAAMLADMAARYAASAIFKALLGGGEAFGPPNPAAPTAHLGGTGGGWLSQIGSWIASGFMANGGDVRPGHSYTVGERGPEQFVPDVAGRIVPNGGGAVYVAINNYSDAKVSAKQSQGQGGQLQLDIMVEAVEGRMAARGARGQGAFVRMIEGRYGTQPVGR